MRQSEYNANRGLYEAANLRGMRQAHYSEKARHAKRRKTAAALRSAIYPGTGAGLALRLGGIVACAMSLSAMVH